MHVHKSDGAVYSFWQFASSGDPWPVGDWSELRLGECQPSKAHPTLLWHTEVPLPCCPLLLPNNRRERLRRFRPLFNASLSLVSEERRRHVDPPLAPVTPLNLRLTCVFFNQCRSRVSVGIAISTLAICQATVQVRPGPPERTLEPPEL